MPALQPCKLVQNIQFYRAYYSRHFTKIKHQLNCLPNTLSMCSFLMKIKAIECDFCEASFIAIHHLKYHMVEIHEKTKPFNCEVLKPDFF